MLLIALLEKATIRRTWYRERHDYELVGKQDSALQVLHSLHMKIVATIWAAAAGGCAASRLDILSTFTKTVQHIHSRIGLGIRH